MTHEPTGLIAELEDEYHYVRQNGLTTDTTLLLKRAAEALAKKDEAIRGLLDFIEKTLTPENIAEGMHAGLRKGSDAPDSGALWRAISESRTSAWSDAAHFAVDPFFTMWGKKPIAEARAALGDHQ